MAEKKENNANVTLSDEEQIEVIKTYYKQQRYQNIYCVLALYKIARNTRGRMIQIYHNGAVVVPEIMHDATSNNIYKEYSHLPSQIIDAINQLRYHNIRKMKVEFCGMTLDILDNLIDSLSEPALQKLEHTYWWADGVTDPNEYEQCHFVVSDDIMRILAYILDDITSCGMYISTEMELECYTLLSKCAMCSLKDVHHRVSIVVKTLKVLKFLIENYLYYGITVNTDNLTY